MADKTLLIFVMSLIFFIATATCSIVLLVDIGNTNKDTSTDSSLRGTSSDDSVPTQQQQESSPLPKPENGTTGVDYPFYAQWGIGCGGTLVHSDFVLSAAQCCGVSGCKGDTVVTNVWNYVFGSGPQNSKKVWIIDREEGGTTHKRKELKIDKYKVHPNYDATSYKYDFVLLQLEKPVKFVDPVQLNSVHNLPDSSRDKLAVIGLADTTTTNNQHHAVLKEADIPYVDDDTCKTVYGKDFDPQSMLCAGGKSSSSSSSSQEAASPPTTACQLAGNSGDPLLDGTMQVGVVSWGANKNEDCLAQAPEDYPGVYSRVSGVQEWIQSNICKHSRSPPESCPQTR